MHLVCDNDGTEESPAVSQALEADLRAWSAAWDDDPKPFVWTKSAEQILARLGRRSHECQAQDTSSGMTRQFSMTRPGPPHTVDDVPAGADRGGRLRGPPQPAPGQGGVLCLAPQEGLGVCDEQLRARHLEQINRFRGT